MYAFISYKICHVIPRYNFRAFVFRIINMHFSVFETSLARCGLNEQGKENKLIPEITFIHKLCTLKYICNEMQRWIIISLNISHSSRIQTTSCYFLHILIPVVFFSYIALLFNTKKNRLVYITKHFFFFWEGGVVKPTLSLSFIFHEQKMISCSRVLN